MEEEGYSFSKSHRCTVAFPSVADDCYDATLTAHIRAVIHCIRDNLCD
jgi:hypothetical protein